MKSFEIQIYCIERQKQFVNTFFFFGMKQSLIIYP